MGKRGFATYLTLTLLVLLIGLVFMATMAGSYAVNLVSSTLARSREAKTLTQIHNADALRSLLYLDYRIMRTDTRTIPGPASVPGGGGALNYLCQNKPSYLAYSWFYEPNPQPGISNCPLFLANNYVGQALSAPPPPVQRSTYSIHHSMTALITAIAPHLSGGGPPLLEYAFTPILVRSAWAHPDPNYLFPFSPTSTVSLSEGSLIDVPGILGTIGDGVLGTFRGDSGSDTSSAPASFTAPIARPAFQDYPPNPKTFTTLDCATSAGGNAKCDSLAYTISVSLSDHIPLYYYIEKATAGNTPRTYLIPPPQIYFGMDQVSLGATSSPAGLPLPRNPFLGGFSYFPAPLPPDGTPPHSYLRYALDVSAAILSTYSTPTADRSFWTETNLFLGVDANDNQVVRVEDRDGNLLYQEVFPPGGTYTTRFLAFNNTVNIRRLQGSSFAMNGQVNLDLVVRSGGGRIVLWDDLTMMNGSCNSTPTWQQGLPVPASCPRTQRMLLHLVGRNSPIYLSAAKNWVLNGVVAVEIYGFDYLSGVTNTNTKIDIHMVGAWFGGTITSSFSPLPRFFFTTPELGRTQRVWPRLPYPFHVNGLQVLTPKFFGQ
jgi:hypothetical protein